MTAPIVNVDWLRARLDDADPPMLCDVRKYADGRDGAAAFTEGHLPGARFVDLDLMLAAPPAPVLGRHPLPDPGAFATTLGSLGIDEHDMVVAYDDQGGAFAARLVWMLRSLGQESALLDGGLTAWDGPLETGPGQPHDPVACRARPWPHDRIADADAVAAHISTGGVVADSRAAPRYRGDVEPLDAVAGHIPGSINLPFSENLDADGRFVLDELRSRFTGAGVDGDAIFSCGSGVTACHNLLAVEAAGLGTPRLYVGSWSGWSTDPERPVATGPE